MAKDNEKDKDDTEAGGNSTLKIIIITVVIALIVVGGGIGATVYLVGQQLSAATGSAPGQEGEEEEVEEEPEIKEEPVYLSLDPAFVTSFNDQTNARFMQFSVQIMARDKEIITMTEKYLPAIRSRLLLLFSSQQYETLITREGKQQLLKDVASEINRFLEEEVGSSGIESAYFTNFIIQ